MYSINNTVNIVKIMPKTKQKKYTSVTVSNETLKILQRLKFKMQSELDKELSLDTVISSLLEKQEVLSA
jgi:hypothetical protein